VKRFSVRDCVKTKEAIPGKALSGFPFGIASKQKRLRVARTPSRLTFSPVALAAAGRGGHREYGSIVFVDRLK
jgi:hypothetical protein